MKNTIKKIGLLFAVVIMVVLCTVSVSALEATGQCGDNVYWNFDETTGELVISGEGDMWDYSYKSPFSNSDIKNVVIEDGVTSIGDGAFYNCMLIKSISLPKSLINIGEDFTFLVPFLKEVILDERNDFFAVEDGVLFNNDKTKIILYPPSKDVTEYTIPDTVKAIGSYAFAAGMKLEKIKVPDSVKEIGFGAFAYSRALKEVNLPDYVEGLDGAFFHCVRLKKLTFPDNITYIDEETLSFSVSLEELNLPKSLIYFGGIGEVASLKELILPEKTETVEGIDDCFALEKIVLPESVKSFSCSAHYLKDLYVYNKDLSFEGVNLKTISNITKEELIKALKDAMFAEFDITEENYDDDALTALQDELWDKYYNLWNSAEFVTSEELTIHGYTGSTAEAYAKENGITFKAIDETDSTTFGQCGDNVYWSFDEATGTLTVSGEGPMYNFGWDGDKHYDNPWEDIMLDIKNVVIEDGVTSVGSNAFVEGFGVGTVVLGESVTLIGDDAFAGCMMLREIVIPENVTTIGAGAFFACVALNKVVIENNDIVFGNEKVFKTYLLPTNDIEDWIVMWQNYLDANDDNVGELEEIVYANTKFLESHMIMPDVTIHANKGSSAETYANELGIAFKELETHTCTFGDWYTVAEATVFAEGVERRDCECGEFETRNTEKLENAVTKDEATKVEITYTDDNFDKSVVVVVAEDNTTANIALADKYESFKAYDISLEADGKKVQPNGKVTVKLPIPEGYNADTIAVYYISDSGEKVLLESKVENGFVIFETDHFSVYAVVDESSKIETPVEPDVPDEPVTPDEPSTPADDCSCNCHKGGIAGFFFKILNFFQKIFGMNKVCACGVKH